MVARIKDLGRDELKSFRARVLRVAGLGRISKGDADNLITLVDRLDAYVISMREEPELEKGFM